MPRPSRYTEELATAILEGMRGGKTSIAMCKELGLPRETVAGWRAQFPEFAEAYHLAFRCRAEGMVEEAEQALAAVPKGASMADVTLARAKADLFRWTASRLVVAFAEPPSMNLTNVVVTLPSNGRDLPLIEGTAIEPEDGA
jgi:hypothetical protein